ncbi:hypothetical protein GUJ93_ZPchr0006g41394 [Zizania palustris]|uniref:Uncharacterized protein n=1 Tax=Zizania palustris TaxID=103762 RepID=A0A8J5VXC7_ZIZPA|nr:hypothetical protein GUJ93_ZPchr0006g41394 [Zizania palustris]
MFTVIVATKRFEMACQEAALQLLGELISHFDARLCDSAFRYLPLREHDSYRSLYIPPTDDSDPSYQRVVRLLATMDHLQSKAFHIASKEQEKNGHLRFQMERPSKNSTLARQDEVCRDNELVKSQEGLEEDSQEVEMMYEDKSEANNANNLTRDCP